MRTGMTFICICRLLLICRIKKFRVFLFIVFILNLDDKPSKSGRGRAVSKGRRGFLNKFCSEEKWVLDTQY